MEGDDLARTHLFNRPVQGHQIGHPPRPNLIAFNQCNTVVAAKIIDHLLVDQGDDDLVLADDAFVRGGPERQGVGSRAIEGFVVHRLNPKLAFLVPLPNIDVPGRCREE